MTHYWNIHTHRPSMQSTGEIVNCTPAQFAPQTGRWYSVGIHPWDVAANGNEPAPPHAQLKKLEQAACHPQVLAIGEAGLDKAASAPMQQQLEAFRQQALLAEKAGKPLIIHLVKATDELLAVKKALVPRQTWVIHGFRGKPQMADTLLRHGFCLSFGEKFQTESLRITPADRLFFETDESTMPIAHIYAQAAAVRGITVEELCPAIEQNVHKVFLSNRLIYKR